MRRCALLLLIALALALLAVGAQAQERGDAAGEPPAAPRISRLSWSGLTIRAEWNPVARATGYDLRWTPEEQRRRHLTVSAERAVDGSPAEVSALWAGRWRVEVRARIGSGPSAVRGEWSHPRIVRVYDAPPRLEVERFDGEYARLNWTGVGASYELEWGERGKAKQFARRDGRSPTLELGPLEGGKTYEFRVRARDGAGRSDYSPTAVFTPTGWRGGRPGAGYVGRIGQIYALWFPQRGAEWYELSWINAADPTETARVRVGTATSGGSRPQVPGQIGREGGFENGTWNVRVRAGPRGVWSPLYPLTLSNQPERLALELESSRELCTAGTLTEVSWKISGGSAPYALSVENSAVDVSADNARINCGALSEAEAADEDAALAAKQVTAVVTDARGVRREAAIDVARARALPAPTGLSYGANVGYAYTTWDWVEGAGSQSPERREYPDNPRSTTIRDQYLVRYRATGGAEWQHAAWATSSGPNVWETVGPGVHEMQVAAIRHSLESETPSALRWSETLRYAYGVAPANPTISTTATTVTVSWDAQPYAGVGEITLAGPNGSRTRIFTEPIEPGRHSVTFSNVPPATSYEVVIDKSTPHSFARGWTTLTARTDAPPAGWTANPTGPQNVTISTSGNEITVTWASPYPGAPNRYDVVITEESTGALVDIIWVTDTTRRWSTGGVFRPIRRGGTYRVRVTHVDLITASVYKTVTVPASTASGAEGAESTDPPVPPIGSFFPFWPLRLNTDHAYTDDPFEWRIDSTDSRYHVGFDLGFLNWATAQARSKVTADDEPGEPIYAVAAGTLRVFNDNLASPDFVLYCPDIEGPFHEQFVVHDEHQKGMTSSGTYECFYLVGPSSGRTALIFHELPNGGKFVTKYAHLRKDSIPSVLVASLGKIGDYIDPDGKVEVYARRKIGELGHSGKADSNLYRARQYFCRTGPGTGTDKSETPDCSAANWANRSLECPKGHICEHAFIDPHLHFEVRYFNGNTPSDWYKSAWSCEGHEGEYYSGQSDADLCAWTKDRMMPTVIDPEQVLRPVPASRVPRDAGLRDPRRECPARGRIECANADRRVVEIDGSSVVGSGRTAMLNVQVSVAAWRPALYSRFAAPPDRFQWAGIRGTRPGVDGYWTSALCPNEAIEHFLNTVYGDGEMPTAEGEVPRETRRLQLTLGATCTLTVYPSNAAYPEGEYDAFLRVRVVRRSDMELRDPSTRVTWVAALSTGEDVVRDARALVGDALDLYTFTARRDYTYRFCTYPSSQSTNECADESDDSEENSNVAQLLIIGADGSITDGVVKNTSGLAWTVPDNAPLEGDYVLVVRRRARVEGSVDDYSYKLKYTVPPIEDCASLGGDLLFLVCIPPKPTPSVSSRTHNTVTVSWPRPTGALSYETKPVTGENCAAEGIVRQFNPHSADAAGVVSGAGNQDIQYPFPNLTPSTSYKLCVRSVRTMSPSFVLNSDWASVPATTRAEQLPKPGGTSVTNVGETSLTLNWSAVADAGGYKVKRTGSSSTWTLPSTSRSHRFTGLTSNFRYTLYVQALPKTGSSKVASAWADEPGRTDSAEPTPTPNPQPGPLPKLDPIDCLSTTANGWATYRGRCDPVWAAMLLPAVQSENPAICGILRHEGVDAEGNDIWVRYGLSNGRRIPGSVDFEIMIGDTVFLGPCVPASGGVSGASDLEVPSCPDAVKPETGPAVVDADASSCTTVRGGGALQISRGEYTLNVSLASDRDWFAFAPTSYTGSSAGAFLFLDLSTGGWIALYPPDGFELERHAPADATGLPALLDAIAASAAPSVYPAADR